MFTLTEALVCANELANFLPKITAESESPTAEVQVGEAVQSLSSGSKKQSKKSTVKAKKGGENWRSNKENSSIDIGTDFVDVVKRLFRNCLTKANSVSERREVITAQMDSIIDKIEPILEYNM